MREASGIADLLSNFEAKPEVRRILSFLAFEDWFARKETERQDWIAVARYWKNDQTVLYTFSALAVAQEGNLEKLLSNFGREVRPDFGMPSFYCSGGEKIARYDSGAKAESGGVEFRPFVIHRDFHGFVPSGFELVQNFLLYHNAFLKAEEGEYQRIDDDGSIVPVARIKREGDNQVVEVDVHHLKDYLAANRSYLVRYHNHQRRAVEDVSDHIRGKRADYRMSDKASSFGLCLSTEMPLNDHKSLSVLEGKDVVFPYQEPDSRHTSFASGEGEEKFTPFIIGRGEGGEEIESTCKQDELSDNFRDRGNPHFLTPVYFNREVLAKYHQEPSRFTVSDSDVSCLDLWNLPIAVNREGLVQVWLGDLGRIPYKQQLHWRGHNVAPRGGVPKYRLLRDLEAQFTEPTDNPVYDFRVGFAEVQAAARATFGEDLFRQLDDKDRHAFETLHIPLTEEWKEFDEQVQALAKVTVDSLNVSLLSRETALEGDRSPKKASIELLEFYLRQRQVSEKVVKRIINALKGVQAIRSSGAAHRKGRKFQKALETFKLVNLSNSAKFRKLIADLTHALSLVAEALRTKEVS